jgi:hypothetical protein
MKFAVSDQTLRRVFEAMTNLSRNLLVLFVWVAAGTAFADMTPEQRKQLPPPASRPVNFGKDIRPILEASCIKCHGHGRNKGDFQLDTRETLLKGGATSPAVVSGKSEQSYLIELVSGVDPDNVMPKKGKKLTAEEISLLRGWIDQGLVWDAEIFLGKNPPKNFTPRRPTLPPAHAGLSHPLDRILGQYFESNKVAWPKVVEDRAFARRAYLDVIGLLPAPEEIEKFVADRSKGKRERLVKRLLADNQRYAEHWLTFWNDALRNDYKGTGYIDGGRKQITGWLYSALASNLSYDRFVAELVNPHEDCEGFTKGIVWRGAVNASQIAPMQAAQNVSQVFMGVNLKCASCHDSLINDWKLSDAYGLANIYSDTPLELFECDKPTGKKAAMQFIFPELGPIGGGTNRAERLKDLATVLTKKENGRLSRTIVNRLWQKFMGRGLVEPVDDMEQPAWNADLLDWLAEDLVDNGYDLKRTIERILTSRAYQLPSVNLGEIRESNFVFRGPTVRRMSAEQFRDALGAITGKWYSRPAAAVDFTVGTGGNSKPESSRARRPGVAGETPAPLAKWIWSETGAAQNAGEATLYLRKEINLSEQPSEAFVVAACDNSFTLYINGQKAGAGKDWSKPEIIDVGKFLVKGKNIIAVKAVNEVAETKEKTEKSSPDKAVAEPQPNPAGFLLQARVRHRAKADRRGEEKVMDFASDASWQWSTNRLANWEKPDFKADGWEPAVELGEASMAPWNAGKKLAMAVASTAQYGRTRASLVAADPLMVALGRPNREQVITVRSPVATTLQMLELANGQTLSRLLKEGSAQLLLKNPASSRELIARLYQSALGRAPSRQEEQLAEEVIGKPAKKEGVEDFLWAMTMLPEFQLIY